MNIEVRRHYYGRAKNDIWYLVSDECRNDEFFMLGCSQHYENYELQWFNVNGISMHNDILTKPVFVAGQIWHDTACDVDIKLNDFVKGLWVCEDGGTVSEKTLLLRFNLTNIVNDDLDRILEYQELIRR